MKKLTTKEFISRSNKIHKNKFNYSLVDYKNQNIKVKLICKEHGEFEQRPDHHLAGRECKLCSCKNGKFLINSKRQAKSFLKRAKKTHEGKYDYSKVVYVNQKEKVIIICPEHGEFRQTPDPHLNGSGCMKCSIVKNADRQRYTTEDFIKKAQLVHGKLYDYSKVDYKGNRIKVEITCKNHGSFFQIPYNHLSEKGCRFCNESKGEKFIAKFLNENKIEFKKEKTFKECINPDTNYKLRFDFYLPNINLCIEYDGKQHFKAMDYFGGEEALKSSKKRDKIKDEYCTENNIHLLRIKYDENVLNKLIQNLQIKNGHEPS